MVTPRNRSLKHLLFLVVCTVSIIGLHARSTGSFLRNVNQTKSIVTDFKPIATERLFIRKITPDDLENLFAMLSNPEIVNQTAALDLHTDRQQTAGLIEQIIACYNEDAQEDFFLFAITLTDDPSQLIGFCGYFGYSPLFSRAELGYALSRAYWGKGIVTEAARALVDFGFTVMKLNRIEATVYPENIASAKVLEKLGMRHEGTLRQHIMRNNVFRDRLIYSLLKSECSEKA